MPESESEDEILDRIETALRKIAGYAQAPKGAPAEGGELNRAALAEALDKIITKLREGLDTPRAAEPPDAPGASGPME